MAIGQLSPLPTLEKPKRRDRRGVRELPPERWFSPANLVTLLRIPLAAVPWIYPDRPVLIAAVVILAGLSDGLDGFLARLEQKDLLREPGRRIGVWLDPLCDKIFVLSTLAALAYAKTFPLWVIPLLATREILLGGFLVAGWMVPRWRPHPHPNLRAAYIGKFATGAQFTAFVALVIHHSAAIPLVVLTATLGALAGIHYVRRARENETETSPTER